MKIFTIKFVFTFCIILIGLTSYATIWQVGSAQTYTLPSAVKNLVNDGDTIYIDGGIYSNDAVKWIKKNLKFIGLGTSGNPTVMQNTGDIANGKGIWVFEQPGVSDNAYIENITFDGAQVSDGNGGNGAGIRYQSANLTIKNCIFKNCQNGILEGGSYSGSNVIIEDSEFDNNGYAGSDGSLFGYEHHIYISANTDTLIVRNCYFHDIRGEGNSLKTRAQRNYILYNLIDEAAGYGSWELNLAQGGLCVVVGNVIIQGTSGANHGIISLDAATNPIQELYFTNNTIINKYAGNARFMSTIPSTGVNVFKFYNNIFASAPGASNTIFATNIPAVIDTSKNILITDYATYGFVNTAANNFNLLSSASSAIDKGTACGSASTGYSLTPAFMYDSNLTPLSARSIIGSAIDIGAYEYNPGVGIAENNEEKIFVYNDYTQHQIIISFPANSGSAEIVIFDITGNKVKAFSNADSHFNWNYDGLSKGMYFITLNSGVNSLAKKFLVN